MNIIQKFLMIGLSFIIVFTSCKKETIQSAQLNQPIVEQKGVTAKSRNVEDLCFSLKFPIKMILFDGSRERIYNLDEYTEIMEWWEENEPNEVAPKLKFPIKAILKNGKVEMINNQNALEQLIESCEEATTEEQEEEEEEENENDADSDLGGEDTGEGEEENGGNSGNTGTTSTDWFTAINGSAEESHGHYIIQCSDGGYLQVGETGFIPNSAKLLVVKTNSAGQLLWKKEFGSAGHNLGNSVLEISDGYLIVGALNQNSALIKVNKSNGAIIFQKTYNTGGNDAFEQVALTSNGIAAVGYRNALDVNNTFYTEGEGYMLFLDNNGNKVKDKNLKNYTSHAYRIKNYNNTLIISGLSYGAENYEVLKMDMSGNVLWKKTYGGNGSNHCFGLDIGQNGAIFLTGHTTSNTQNWDTYTMKLDNNGQLIWEQKRGNPRGFDPRYIHDEAWDIRATPDGGCIVIAGTGDEYGNYSNCQNGVCSDKWEVYVLKYSSTGQLEWQQTYAQEVGNDWAGEAIDLTADGGAIIGVDNGQFGFLKMSPF